MSELKPCPFCGGEVHRIGGEDEEVSHDIECDGCAYIFYDICVDDAWWNTRPIEDALNQRIAELEENAILARCEYEKRILDMASDVLKFSDKSIELITKNSDCNLRDREE